MTALLETKHGTQSARTAYCDTFQTPLGAFSVAVDEKRAVLAAAFGDPSALALSGREAVLDAQRTSEAREQLEAYFAGKRREFTLPLAPAATPFQQRYRDAMARLGFGETTTYGRLAQGLGTSARAAGRANATNPICLIVPCHRVIGADGSLVGFGGGMERKRWLLHHEGALADGGDLFAPV